jgi:hypothetical protein
MPSPGKSASDNERAGGEEQVQVKRNGSVFRLRPYPIQLFLFLIWAILVRNFKDNYAVNGQQSIGLD